VIILIDVIKFDSQFMEYTNEIMESPQIIPILVGCKNLIIHKCSSLYHYHNLIEFYGVLLSKFILV